MFRSSALLGISQAWAELCWLQLHGRRGVTLFQSVASFEISAVYAAVLESSRLGCAHSSGVLSYCLVKGFGCRQSFKRALPLARASSAAGCRFGQFVMGLMHSIGNGQIDRSNARALHYFRLAASQHLDAAQCSLGDMYTTTPCSETAFFACIA
jgi:TPR repeat protein